MTGWNRPITLSQPVGMAFGVSLPNAWSSAARDAKFQTNPSDFSSNRSITSPERISKFAAAEKISDEWSKIRDPHVTPNEQAVIDGGPDDAGDLSSSEQATTGAVCACCLSCAKPWSPFLRSTPAPSRVLRHGSGRIPPSSRALAPDRPHG